MYSDIYVPTNFIMNSSKIWRKGKGLVREGVFFALSIMSEFQKLVYYLILVGTRELRTL
jgi:hypothetical protein